MLKKAKLRGYPLPVATVGQATRDSAETGDAIPAIALKDDVWLEGGVFVVDFGADTPCDILEVWRRLAAPQLLPFRQILSVTVQFIVV